MSLNILPYLFHLFFGIILQIILDIMISYPYFSAYDSLKIKVNLYVIKSIILIIISEKQFLDII